MGAGLCQGHLLHFLKLIFSCVSQPANMMNCGDCSSQRLAKSRSRDRLMGVFFLTEVCDVCVWGGGLCVGLSICVCELVIVCVCV